MKKIIILILFLVLKTSILNAQQAGSLDSTFGLNGMVVTSVGGFDDRIRAIEIQPDDKIVIGGASSVTGQLDFVIARYLIDGTLDSSFGTNGFTITNITNGTDIISDIALQNDGKIVVAGDIYNGTIYPDIAIARYNYNGNIDSNFATNGISVINLTGLNDNVRGIKIAQNGNIYVSGSANQNAFIISFRQDGTLNTSFNNTGILYPIQNVINGFTDITMQSNNQIIAAGGLSLPLSGADFLLMQFDSSGMPDSSFGINGVVTTDLGAMDGEGCVSMDIKNNKIVLGGIAGINANQQDYDFALASYNLDGSVDSSFNVAGQVITHISNGRDLLSEIKIQNDGKIVATGYTGGVTDFVIVRYNIDGSLDSTFGVNGIVITDFASDFDIAYAMAIQNDYKILAGGTSVVASTYGGFALARYFSGLNVGVIDFKKQPLPLQAYPNPVASYATLSYSLSKDENIAIILFDMQGKEIKTFIPTQKKIKGAHTEYLYFEETIKPGIYFLSIENGDRLQSVKIVKE